MSSPLLPARFLFRFSVPCLHTDALWSDNGAELDAHYRLVGLSELEGGPPWADVRAAWNNQGLAFSIRVQNKKTAPWCRVNRIDDSDSVHLWIDTRDVHNVHRASRFCHRFVALPFGNGARADKPFLQWMPIHRARDNPNTIDDGLLQAHSQKHVDGYSLDLLIPAAALTGFDPDEHPRLGFHYAVLDRELGEQTLAAGSPMPYREDPSLWATLELASE
ncbi:MAG: hypothetical protein GXX96_27835 [Planctomycetaceae bacterium]|nr:hypothetical protein [Planctomycetaceae bacterium]